MHAAELMTPDPVVVERKTPITAVAGELHRHDIGSIPVVESRRNRKLLGMITDRDIAVRCVANRHSPADCSADHHMTRAVRTATVEDDVATILRTMRGLQIRRLPVVDGDDRVIGIITQADIAIEALKRKRASEIDVAHTLQRISLPPHPRRRGIH